MRCVSQKTTITATPANPLAIKASTSATRPRMPALTLSATCASTSSAASSSRVCAMDASNAIGRNS
jgi:hypothetical protein